MWPRCVATWTPSSVGGGDLVWSADSVQTLIALLLGTGGATAVTAIVRGLHTLKSGARAQERAAVTDLGRSRDEANSRARLAEADRDFWRLVAGRRAYQLTQVGIEPEPRDPVPPSERLKPDAR